MKPRVIDRSAVSALYTTAFSVCKSIFDCTTMTCVTRCEFLLGENKRTELC
jgi:hypothetical protein